MDHRSEDIEFVRSVDSPSVDENSSEINAVIKEEDLGSENVEKSGDGDAGADPSAVDAVENGDDDSELPQCKIKRNYSCNLCPFFSQNPRSFLYHSRDVHFDKIKIYECSQCLYASKHSQKLQRHISMIHVPGKVRKVRNKMIRSDRKEPRPIRPKPPDESPESPGKIADEVNDEKNGDGNGEVKCSACHYKHKNTKLVLRHEKIAHLKKRFLKCHMCSYVTHVTARFTKHVKYHSMPMIKCDICDFRSPYKWNLDRHYKSHCGTGVFKCSKCNFRADIKQSLTVHETHHHVPPVGQGVVTRRRSKVGGSRVQQADPDKVEKEESELLESKKENSDLESEREEEIQEDQKTEEVESVQNLRNVKVPYSNKRESANNSHLQPDFIHPDDIVPRYGQIYVKNLKCKFCSYKAVFSHEIWRHEKRIHGYVRPENKKENAPKRPPPKLIPIQNKSSPSAILKIPTVKNKPVIPPFPETTSLEKPVNDTEFNEMCKKSCLTSSLKDFVSLIGDEEGLKTIPDSSREDIEAEFSSLLAESTDTSTDTSETKNDDLTKQKQTDLLKKKNASFFDKLKEKLLTGSNEEQSLFCEVCGHESKCLSEAVAHEKRHSNASYKSDSDSHMENDIILSGAELSSTRCQHCRQRCKTSTDLINHLKSCKAFEASLDSANADDPVGVEVKVEEVSLGSEASAEDDGKSMENRVFVWNDLGQMHDEENEGEGMDVDAQLNEEPLVTVPGYGTVTSKGHDNTESGTLVMEADPRLNVIVKKVFKCPHCSFWASTASRFHVHIVGHLNKKPFECSLCLYRSNWRWDITKHIRLKSLRDPSHSAAKVNMTDETGRRNYTKYNRFLTMMKVQEPTAESSGYGRRSRPGDATQGNVNDKDIIPLPAPPRLTRAPTPGMSHQMPQGMPLRPPPLLKAAQVPPHSNASKNSKESVKKSFWKCKKCNFRDPQKGRVLLHVKKHYMFKKHERNQSKGSEVAKNNSAATSKDQGSQESNSELRSLLKTPSYSCGHCHQVSNWKHVIQRHCKLKHNGDSVVVVKWKEESYAESTNSEEKQKEHVEVSSKTISCDICPFTAHTEGDLTAHKLYHIDRPGSIFKCTHCPFYVPSKIAVLEHMEIHGGNNKCDMTSITVDNFDPNEELMKWSEGDTTKKYKCIHCPYISNSRSQFLYHKQFHRPRNSPFKCLYCTYNVTRRHLLHQHLRVHHNREGKAYTWENESNKCAEEKFESEAPKEEIEPTSKKEDQDLTSKEDQDLTLKKEDQDLTLKKEDQDLTSKEEDQDLTLKKEDQDLTSKEENQDLTLKKEDQVLTSKEKDQDLTLKKEDQVLTSKEEDQDLTLKEEEAESISEKEESPYEEEKKILENLQTGNDQDSVGLNIPEIPLVWVIRAGTIQKMFKCRWCPHVNIRKVNIQEHEKMHKPNENKNSTGGAKLRCPECNYTSNNAGVIASHSKVHQGFYGEIRSPVDPTRPEFEQIMELQNSLRIMEPEVVVIEGSTKELEIGGSESLSSQPESAYSHTTRNDNKDGSEDCRKILSFCDQCPARFFFKKELRIHSRFHMIHLPFRCSFCSYTARQRPHLLAHYKVHSQEYKEKTAKLIEVYAISPEHPQPHAVRIRKVSTVMDGPLWVVKSPDSVKKGAEPRHECHRCPAKFFKSVALQYHLTLHGSNNLHKCEYCDYSVKTYGNLMKHQLVHKEKFSKAATFSYYFPISDKDVRQLSKADNLDPQFGTLMLGSPEFIYPTYMKKGKIKEKRYKCHKCPNAFLKREQYRVHLSLHGSKQKYQCEICDYSVKYYANYIQHMRTHESHEKALKAKKLNETSGDVLLEFGSKEGGEGDKKVNELSMFEQQSMLLQERKKSVDCKEEERKTYCCGYCPYVSNRKDAIENHSWRHYFVSGMKSTFECTHCDYSTTQNNYLREHKKLHFNDAARYKAEAYLKCEKMELWCSREDAKNRKEVLIFQDRGEEVPNRYFPPIGKYDSNPVDDENYWGLDFSPKTDHSLKENEDSSFEDSISTQSEDLMDLIEEQIEEVLVEKVKPKRYRGKNWRCDKCPHAFMKRDQFLRHSALHGSNQRYNCDICDYSVKFYTNYVQHMKMHQMHEPDKVICLKKNFQNLLSSLDQPLDESAVEKWVSHPSTSPSQGGTPMGVKGLENIGHECTENPSVDENPEEKEDFQLQRARGSNV